MSNSRAGQPSERTPDFIPGWFEARPGNPDPATREAVRFIGTQDFPINFLRPTEMVFPAPPPQLGVCVGERDSAIGMCLAVPPGYWMVRDADGRPQLYSDEDFKVAYIRNDGQDWIAPVERDRPFDESSRMEKVAADLASGAGWKGTPPAEGTRRALILGVIDNFAVRLISGVGGKATKRSCLNLADEIEAALLKSTIDDEARDSVERLDTVAEENERRGSRELHVVLADNTADSPQMLFVELEDEKGASVGGFEHRLVGQYSHIVIPVPYPVGPVGVACARGGTHSWPRNPTRDGTSCLKCGTTPEEAGFGFRDDAWVTEVVYQAAGAASGVFLREDGEKIMPAEEVGDAVAELLLTFGIPRACGGCQEEQLEHGRKEVAKPELSRAEGAVDLRPPDEFDIGRAARERLHERLTEGPVPNPAELARVIDILR